MSQPSARRRRPPVVLLVAVFLMLSATALYAAQKDQPAQSGAAAQPVEQVAAQATSPEAVAPPAGLTEEGEARALVLPRAMRTSRPAALIPLYATFAVLQGLDARSTLTAIHSGASEANPLLGGVASNSGALLAVKMGAAAGTILVAEKLWHHNPVAAVALMIGLNSAYAIIVAHNYHVAGSMH